MNDIRHWFASVPWRVRLRRLAGHPRKLKTIVGDPRSRAGAFFPALHDLSSRYGRYTDLTPFEFRVFSQHGEDGVVAEIVRRIGDRLPRTFVEFGAGAGATGNTVFLADVLGWRGLFIEPAGDDFASLARKYQANDRIRTIRAFVGPDNVDDLLKASDWPAGLGVLSIDVDGNDYYVWQALSQVAPALVVIEYNGALPVDRRLVQPLSSTPWTGTDYFGASLAALTSLAGEKGYFLVHTDLAGLNAFFVRREFRDLFSDLTTIPRRAANYELLGFSHPPDRTGRTYIDLDAGAAGAHDRSDPT